MIEKGGPLTALNFELLVIGLWNCQLIFSLLWQQSKPAVRVWCRAIWNQFPLNVNESSGTTSVKISPILVAGMQPVWFSDMFWPVWEVAFTSYCYRPFFNAELHSQCGLARVSSGCPRHDALAIYRQAEAHAASRKEKQTKVGCPSIDDPNPNGMKWQSLNYRSVCDQSNSHWTSAA